MPTPEQDAFFKEVFAADPAAYEALKNAPDQNIKLPPEGVLKRAGDGALFWEPNSAVQTIAGACPPAPSDWVKHALAFYDLAPPDDPADRDGNSCVFNSAPSTIDAVVQLLGEQATLAGYTLAAAAAKSAAAAILKTRQEAMQHGGEVAVEPDPGSKENLDYLAGLKMPDLLDALSEIKRRDMLDAVAKTARDPRLRVAILSVQQKINDEWTKLMAGLADDEKNAITHFVYGLIIKPDTAQLQETHTLSTQPAIAVPPADDDDKPHAGFDVQAGGTGTIAKPKTADAPAPWSLQATYVAKNVDLKKWGDPSRISVDLFHEPNLSLTLDSGGALTAQAALALLNLHWIPPWKKEIEVPLSAFLNVAVSPKSGHPSGGLQLQLEQHIVKYFSITVNIAGTVDNGQLIMTGGGALLFHIIP